MKKIVNKVNRSMREILADTCHEGWGVVFELFFTYLADSSGVGFEKLVADAVTDYVCEVLPEDYTLSHKEIKMVYTLYADFADLFEARVREHITNKVNHGDLCEVA